MDEGEVIEKWANCRFSRNIFFPLTYDYARSGPVTDSGKVSMQGQDQPGLMRAYGMRTTLSHRIRKALLHDAECFPNGKGNRKTNNKSKNRYQHVPCLQQVETTERIRSGHIFGAAGLLFINRDEK